MNVSLPARASAAALAAGLLALTWPTIAAAGADSGGGPVTNQRAAAPDTTGVCATQGAAHDGPVPTQRDLLLAGAALMVGIALRRASF